MDAHRGAFEYDWRARFHLPLTVVGDSMTWGEAIRLSRVIRLDPSSALSMALNEWDRPTSREALVLMDVYDVLDATRAGKKARRYPRPWGDKARNTIGRGARLTKDQLRRVLDAHRTDGEGGQDG